MSFPQVDHSVIEAILDEALRPPGIVRFAGYRETHPDTRECAVDDDVEHGRTSHGISGDGAQVDDPEKPG